MYPNRPIPRTAKILFAATAAIASLATTEALAAPSYTLFESGQVRPLALSPSGKYLFAANTPDNRLEVFRVKKGALIHRASVPVGLEPVAVAARSDHEVWVVNHLSDSVSIVRLDPPVHGGEVVRTLLVGDEPRDIVFAGPGRSRAFITAAHRGQNAPFDPQLTTAGVGRADVWVFDADDAGGSLGGDPLAIVNLFADTPRALAVTPDGAHVYAAAFHSGNRTTTVNELLVPDGFGPGGLPGPSTNHEGVPAPETGLIVKFDGAHWLDQLGRAWDDQIRFSLPDKDVFVIDAMADPPAQLAGEGGFFSGVGTTLFNIAVNPVTGSVYVSNTDARNEVRFEGPGVFGGSSVRGHLAESRITVLGAAGVTPRHLNKHIDYSTAGAPVPNDESERSLAFPQDMAITADGSELYVAALGSSKVGVYDTAALEDDSFIPDEADQIELTGGGPTGLALDERHDQLFVLTRFDNSISVISTASRAEIAHVPMHNPEPPSVVQGRRFLYDARYTSSHGDSACASCHMFGDMDHLAWDLGNPDDEVIPNPGPFTGATVDPLTGAPIDFASAAFHPMKGPMTTQSLRGMDNHGPMHWRGDRTGGNEAPSAQPDGGSFDEDAAFKAFNPAFVGLLGRQAPLSDAEMQAFTDFILQVTYPPNPIRALDNSLTPEQQLGRDFYFGPPSFLGFSCASCHALDPQANPDADRPGFFGTSGASAFEGQPQLFKIPHLRNMYQKVGMFGLPEVPGVLPGNHGFQGDQIRGFGFLHDGSVDTMFRFFSAIPFADIFPGGGIPVGPGGDALRRSLESFMLAFDSNLAPIVGQQATLSPEAPEAAGPRIDLLRARADAGECDLIAKGAAAGQEMGFLYVGAGQFLPARAGQPAVADAVLRQLALAAGRDLTYTCAPPGAGLRMALDRDLDGALDGDELLAGTDPADPSSAP